MKSFRKFITRVVEFTRLRYRILVACLFLISIIIIFTVALICDFKMKNSQYLLGGLPGGKEYNYILTFTSIDGNNDTIKGRLDFKTGLPKWRDKEEKILYGELVYADLTYTYAVWPKETADFMARLFIKNTKATSLFSASTPKSKDVSIKMLGNHETYPFDKYLIVGAVSFSAYLSNGGKQADIINLNGEETVVINNFIPGMFMRKPTLDEFLEAKSAFKPWDKAQAFTENNMKELNNYENRFALIIERPIFLQFLTVILGLIAFASAIYIGWRAQFDAIPLQIAGYVIALWGIRNNIIGEMNSFPTGIDYALLIMYLIILSGIIFRKIAGKKPIKADE